MSMKPARRSLLLALALILCLLPATAQAGMLDLSSRSEARIVATRVQEGEDGIFSAVWKRLAFLLEKAGAGIDPTGGTGETGGSSGSNSGNGGADEGASIDPSGTPGG